MLVSKRIAREFYWELNPGNPLTTVEIVVLVGELILERDVNGFEANLELNNLTSGVYSVRVISKMKGLQSG